MTTFKTTADAIKQLGEVRALALINTALANANYRKAYNKRRNALQEQLRNDPVVQKRLAELKTKIG